MKAYLTDLRERAVSSVESGECAIPEAARRYRVSEPSLERWLARKRITGNCAPLPHAGGVRRKLATAETAIRDAVKAQPDAIVLDIAWQGDRDASIKAIPRISAKCPDTQIVAVTVYPELAERALAVGAYALEKSFSKAELLDTIRWVVQTKGTPGSSSEHKEIEPLTPQEREILAEMVKGSADKQIAYQLQLAEGTVKKHVSSILGKLDVTSRTEAAVIAERRKLI